MIAIPNMSKPKICYMCPLSDETWFCPIVGEAIPRDNRRLENCTIIEIDEKAFNEVIKGYLEGLKAIQNEERRSNDTD